MMPPDLFFLLYQQRRQEMVRRAEQARSVRVSRRTPESSESVFPHLLWWVGSALLSWGCALQRAGRTTQAVEKGAVYACDD
jgi:hypothetical protein